MVVCIRHDEGASCDDFNIISDEGAKSYIKK